MAVGTTRGAHLGGAYVTVDAEVGGFGGRLIAKLRRELKAADAEARARGRELGKDLADGILQGFMRRLPGLRRDIEMALRTIRARIDIALNVEDGMDTNINFGVDYSALESDLDKAGKRIKNTGRQIQRDVSNIAGGVIGRMATVAAGLSKTAESALLKLKGTMGSAVGNAVTLAAAIELIYAAALMAISAFNAIGREITNILKLGLMLPGLLATIAAVALPLMVVFQGLGDDFKGIFDADPKKAKEAMDKLGGSVKVFAQELRAAKPWYDDLKKSVRESFFQNITGIIPHIIKNFGGAIKTGFNQIASSVSGLLKSIFEALSTPETLRSIQYIFDVVSRMMDKLSGPGSNFFIAMRNAAVASMPAIERLFGLIGKAVDEFSNWLNESISSGDFNEWLNDGINTLKELYDLAKEIMDLLGVLFDEGNQDGESFIVEITNMIKKFREFAEGEEGKLALEGIAVAAEAATGMLKTVLVVVVGITAALASLVGAVDRAVNALKRFLGMTTSSAMSKGLTAATRIATGAPTKSTIGSFASGGIIREPIIASFAEDGPEVAIPLNKPGRARQLLRESGLDRMIPSHAEQGVQVQVYIGNEQLDSRVYEVSRRATNASVGMARLAGLDVSPE